MIHPAGMSESSRWSQRSEDHRNDGEDKVHPEGVPEDVQVCRKIIEHFWQPSGMHCLVLCLPGVFDPRLLSAIPTG